MVSVSKTLKKMGRWEKYRKGLSELFLPIYDNLHRELPEGWEPYHGFRSIEEQDSLYAQGRNGNTKPIVTFAKGGESPHNYGCAVDVIYFKDGFPQWVQSSDTWAYICNIIMKVGGEWGGSFHKFKDRPHIELPIKCSWRDINRLRLEKGMEAAMLAIKENL